MEFIHKKKAEKARTKMLKYVLGFVRGSCLNVVIFVWALFIEPKHLFLVLFYSDQAEARRQKVKEARKRRDERINQKKQERLQAYQREDETAASKK